MAETTHTYFSGGWKSKIGANCFSFWWGFSPWLADGCLVPVLIWKRERDLSPLTRLPSFCIRTSFELNYLLKTLCPDIVTLGIRALTCEFWKETIQSMAWPIIEIVRCSIPNRFDLTLMAINKATSIEIGSAVSSMTWWHLEVSYCLHQLWQSLKYLCCD